MKQFKNKYGDWGLLVGSSQGIGEAFAQKLASLGMNLILVDKDPTALAALSERLGQDFNIELKCLCLDLNDAPTIATIIETLNSLKCRLLIYNAAFSKIKRFNQYSEHELEQFINVNMAACLRLTHAFSKYLIEKKQGGGILLISSLAGLLGMEFIAPYAASKAFTWNLAESLYYELKPHGIDVSACIAGATITETYLNTNPRYGRIKPQLEQPTTLVENALKKLGKKPFFISGFTNRLNYFLLTRILPRKMAGKIANRVMAQMYESNV